MQEFEIMPPRVLGNRSTGALGTDRARHQGGGLFSHGPDRSGELSEPALLISAGKLYFNNPLA